MLSGKKTQGRRKVELTRMTNKSNMQVTFSKRRSGLFKKASELSTLCGAELAVVVFSPSEKVYSFGHPNIDTVIDRYLSGVPHQNYGTLHSIEAQHRANIIELNSRLNGINNMMEAEKMTKDKLSQIRNTTEAQYWWARPFDEMNLDELEFLKKINEDLKSLIAQSANRYIIQGDPTQTLPYFGGNGSTSTMLNHHQPNPQAAAQMFMAQPIQNPMVQPYFLGFNNMGGGGGEGGYGPNGSFF